MNNKIISTLSFSLILLIWGASFYDGIETAIEIWTVSEIFTHCLFVIPGACYLIFQKRAILSQQPFKPNYWLILPLIGTLIFYTFGVVGDIRLFMHIATFVSLPLLIWMAIGNQAANKIAFPLYFMLFSIPIGEELIPFLQELTTDLAVPLIELSGVPIFRNGLYLDIPEGRFLVAEACSGISFLIASVVFGNLYAYLSFKTLPKKLVFVLVSIAVPILANAIRVFGIILTAHLTDMEYAAGADHIIYGGIFYAIILFLLIVIGEKFRDKDINLKVSSKKVTLQTNLTTNLWPVIIAVVTLFSVQFGWLTYIENNRTLSVVNQQMINVEQLPFTVEQKQLLKWQPQFPNADETKQGYMVSGNDNKIDFFVAAYNSGKGELISSMNKLYSDSRWTLVDSQIISLNGNTDPVQLTTLVSPVGEARYILHWLQVENKQFTSRIKAKLYQTGKLLLGKEQPDSALAFSMQTSTHSVAVRKELISFVSNEKAALDKVLLRR
jgi:exosortase A